MSEHQEQVTFFDWVRLLRSHAPSKEVRKAMSLCYSNQTGAHMSKPQAAKMKAEGMTKGILDINLDCRALKPEKAGNGCFKQINDFFISLRIEMKFGKGKLSKEQKEKKALFEEAGFKVAVCYSAVEAIRAVCEYLPFDIADYQGVREFLK